MTDILQRLVDAQLDHNALKCGWAAEAADEIRKLRLEYDAMTRSRDYWRDMAVRRNANLEQYSRRAENDIAELTRERDALAADAARYRYLRNRNRDDVLLKSGPSAGVWCDCEDDEGSLTLLTGEALDSDIDAALAGNEES